KNGERTQTRQRVAAYRGDRAVGQLESSSARPEQSNDLFECRLLAQRQRVVAAVVKTAVVDEREPRLQYRNPPRQCLASGDIRMQARFFLAAQPFDVADRISGGPRSALVGLGVKPSAAGVGVQRAAVHAK